MKTKVFTMSISVDGNGRYDYHVKRQNYSVPQMDRWLAENPDVVVKAMTQSHSYHKGNMVYTDAIVVITTVIYDIQPQTTKKRVTAKRR